MMHVVAVKKLQQWLPIGIPLGQCLDHILARPSFQTTTKAKQNDFFDATYKESSRLFVENLRVALNEIVHHRHRTAMSTSHVQWIIPLYCLVDKNRFRIGFHKLCHKFEWWVVLQQVVQR
jgi:hypothetical protein